MDRPDELVSEPFDFRGGGVIAIEASASAPPGTGAVEFLLEGSEDETCWTGVLAGTTSSGERVEVPCEDRGLPWGRVRLRTFGGDASVSLRRLMKDKAQGPNTEGCA